MNFQLKNIKYSAFASEETHCYEATLYLNGKRFCIVSNSGHGGCDDYHPMNGMTGSELWDRIKKIDAELNKEVLQCDGFTVNNSLEIICGNLMNEYHQKKEFKGWMRKVIGLDGDKVIEWKITAAEFKRNKEQYVTLISKKFSGVILNTLSFDDAFALVKKQTTIFGN